MNRKFLIIKYSLIECLLVIAMLAFLMTFLIMFFNKGTKLCRQYSTRAYTNQQIMILKNKWRKFIHKSDGKLFSTANKGNRFIAGTKSVEIQDHYIKFINAQKIESYKLSENINVNFKIENQPEQILAIMNLELSSPFLGDHRNEVVRIVACPKTP